MSKYFPALSVVFGAICVGLLALLTWGETRVGDAGRSTDHSESDSGQPGASATTENSLALKNDLAALRHEISLLSENEGSIETEKKLDLLIERLDDLASQVYSFQQDNRRDLMRIQSNLMRRLAKLEMGGRSQTTRDPLALKEQFAKEGVEMNVSAKWIRVKGHFISPHQALELVAINEGGKSHEAFMMLDTKPSTLRSALTSLGLESGRGADWQTGALPTGAPLWIYVSWEGLKRPWRLEDMILDVREDVALTEPKWVFSGSSFQTDFRTGEEYFLADVNRAVISLVHKFSNIAVITSAHPDMKFEDIWIPNPETLPKALRSTAKRLDSASNEGVKEWDGQSGAEEGSGQRFEFELTISGARLEAMEWRK